MALDWASARNWLNTNKVFFETLGILSLAIFGLFISFQTYTIAENEANFAVIKDQPIFLFESYWVKFSGESIFFSSTPINISIYNVGPPLRRFNCIDREIMVFKSHDESKSVEEHTEIVVHNYFKEGNTGAPTGKLFELTRMFPNNESSSTIDDVLRAFSTYPGGRDEPVFLVYLWLNYIDYSGNVQNQYFQISKYEAIPIPITEGENIFQKYLIFADAPGLKSMFSHEINYTSVSELRNESPLLYYSNATERLQVNITDEWYVIEDTGEIEHFILMKNIQSNETMILGYQ